MSGGVDSAVSAALLTRQGFDVTGVFIKTWHPDFLPCSWRQERREAMRAAAHLQIPFLTLDLEDTYRREVAERMVAEYAAGRTPNPDVLCNREVKFGGFLTFARSQGALVATGHYARVMREGGETHLYSGRDPQKDQSYFLWMVGEKNLKDVLFPIGNMHKAQVRDLARRFRLPNAEKRDSQGICFLGEVSIEDFLSHFLELREGDVLDTHGRVIGTHRGAVLYASGQRHGFSVSGSPTPLFVVAKDIPRNTITVAPTPPHEVLSRDVSLSSVNWIGTVEPGPCLARLRYRETLREAEFSFEGGRVTLYLREPTLIPSGQSAVLYRGERVLGGGILD